jgi:hypothetical protein
LSGQELRRAGGFVTAAPSDADRLFIVEKTGTIKILDLTSGVVQGTPFLNLVSQINPTGEQGLLGLALDPHFVENGYFYVKMINLNADNEIRRFQVSSAASSTLVLRGGPVLRDSSAAWLRWILGSIAANFSSFACLA